MLLIEDDPIQARLVREYLSNRPKHPFELVHVKCLEDGLRHLVSNRPDVVLLDLTLPDSAGEETFHSIHQKVPVVPIVVLTGMEDEEMGARLVTAGAQDYLIKTEISASIVSRTLRYAIERKRASLERDRLLHELQNALAEVKTLSGLLPICSHCKKIRDDKGYWTKIENYVTQHSGARFSHGLCPECIKIYFPEA